MSSPINCARCGKVHQPNGLTDLCPDCFEKDREEFDMVREYIYYHPGAKIFELVTNLDISVNRVKRYLREGRLEIIEKTNQFLTCEACKKSIQSGKYCDDCARKVAHEFKTSYGKESKDGKESAAGQSKINYRSPDKSKKASVR